MLVNVLEKLTDKISVISIDFKYWMNNNTTVAAVVATKIKFRKHQYINLDIVLYVIIFHMFTKSRTENKIK